MSGHHQLFGADDLELSMTKNVIYIFFRMFEKTRIIRQENNACNNFWY
jgi:hypothetical protein